MYFVGIDNDFQLVEVFLSHPIIKIRMCSVHLCIIPYSGITCPPTFAWVHIRTTSYWQRYYSDTIYNDSCPDIPLRNCHVVNSSLFQSEDYPYRSTRVLLPRSHPTYKFSSKTRLTMNFLWLSHNLLVQIITFNSFKLFFSYSVLGIAFIRIWYQFIHIPFLFGFTRVHRH